MTISISWRYGQNRVDCLHKIFICTRVANGGNIQGVLWRSEEVKRCQGTQWGSNRGMAHQYTSHYWRACTLAGMEPGNALYPHNRCTIPHVVDTDVPPESEASTPPVWACPEEYKEPSQDWVIGKEAVTAWLEKYSITTSYTVMPHAPWIHRVALPPANACQPL